jgi:ABC-2 type transport system permease protein
MSHIRREFLKLLYQKRTYFGWAGLFVVPFLIAIAVHFNGGSAGGPNAQQDPTGFYFGIIGVNGLYVSVAALGALVFFLLPLLAAVAGSQTIAGEAEKGTLRTTLMQPVRRGALLAAKWFVANLYVAIGLLILLVGSLIAGGAFFGFKPPTVIGADSVALVSVGHGLALILMDYLFVFVAMAATVSLALLFSTLTDSGLTAVAGSMVLVIIMIVLGNLPALSFLDPYLFTGHLMAWINVFRDPIVWGPLRDALINFAVWIAATTGLAWVIFRRKDIHS